MRLDTALVESTLALIATPKTEVVVLTDLGMGVVMEL